MSDPVHGQSDENLDEATVVRRSWSRSAVHKGSRAEWESAGGSKKRLVKRLLDRDAAEFQSTGVMKVNRLQMSAWSWLSDPFHTVLVMKTLPLMLGILFCYVSTWLIFALAWLAVSKYADCGVTLETYTEAFYLSIESITTIGYGVDDQYFNDCVNAAPVLACGSMTALLMDTALLGIVLLRFGLSSRRTRALVFSDMALLQVIDGKVKLKYRMFGMHRNPLLQAGLQVYCLQHTYVGPRLKVDVRPMEVETPDMDPTNGPVFLGLPLLITHHIGADSPLAPPGLDRDPTYSEMKQHLAEHPFLEIIVKLGGTVEHTGNTCEKRHSYTLDDIFWNREFKECVTLDKDGIHQVDFHDLHETRKITASGDINSTRSLDSIESKTTVVKKTSLKHAGFVIDSNKEVTNL